MANEDTNSPRPDPADRPAPAPSFFREIGGDGALASPGADGQRELALEFESLMDATAALRTKTRGTYTAESFRERDPHRYQLAKVALAAGYRVNTVATALGMAWETVRAIQRAEDDPGIREVKRKFALGLADVIELGIEGLLEQAKAKKLGALDVAVLTDKYLLLSGEATSITESRQESPAMAAYREFVAMGLGAAENSQVGGVAAGGEVPGVRRVDGKVVDDGASGDGTLDNK